MVSVSPEAETLDVKALYLEDPSSFDALSGKYRIIVVQIPLLLVLGVLWSPLPSSSPSFPLDELRSRNVLGSESSPGLDGRFAVAGLARGGLVL